MAGQIWPAGRQFDTPGIDLHNVAQLELELIEYVYRARNSDRQFSEKSRLLVDSLFQPRTCIRYNCTHLPTERQHRRDREVIESEAS